MADIFISYSEHDRDFANQLYRELERFRVRGFMDQSDISAGADFSRQIKEAIQNADALLVILSESAAQSSFVMAEIGLAQSIGKTVMPVLAPGESYELSVPPQLLDRVVIDAGSVPIEQVAAKVVAAITNTSIEVSLTEVKSRTMRRKRLLRILIGVLLSLIVAFSGMAKFAFEQKNIAAQEMRFAKEARVEAEKARAEAEEWRMRLEILTSGNASMALAPNGRSLATGSRDGSITIWDMNTGQVLDVLEGHRDSISGLAYSPDGRLVASASWDKVVRIWDISTGEPLARLVGHTDLVIVVQFAPDGQLLFSRSLDGTVRQWDVASGKLVKVLEVPE